MGIATNSRWDVIIIGAGPAGSTAAALLAGDGGHRVLVLEKDHFPRWHIGESLLPMGAVVHERLGVTPEPDGFMDKTGAVIVHEASDRAAPFSFDEALDGMPNMAWHVERDRFDTQLRDLARAAGAEVRHGEKVVDVAIDDDGVAVTTASGTERGRFVVDATGMDKLMGRRAKGIEPIKKFGRAAVYGYFEGLSDAAVEEIGPGNRIRIMLVDDGWAWYIPLPHRRLSVGVVTRNKTATTDLFADYLANSPMLTRWTRGTEQSAPGIERNFSYHNRKAYGARYACIGDAGGFLDPIFSSGVALAMHGAARLADSLGPALSEGREGDPRLLDAFGAHIREGYRVFETLIDRFYNTNFSLNFLLSNAEGGDMRRGLISLLAGDVWRPDNRFWAVLDKSTRRRQRGRAVAQEGAIR